MNTSSLALLEADTPLATFTATAWDQHATQPAVVAAALRARAAALPADADGAAAIGLAEHLWLSHLHDAPGLAAWLRSLPATLIDSAESAAALTKARWAVAQVLSDAEPAPEPAPEPSAPARARALQNIWAYQAATGNAHGALAALEQELPRALADADAARCRALAATCNNLALDGREGPRGDAARDALMFAAAIASRQLWARVGTWLHAERAEYQLARCHAALGHGERALAHARSVLTLLEANAATPEADAFEWFYGWEALAWAARAAGQRETEADAIAKAQAQLGKVEDAELRGWCEESLAALQKH